MKKYLPSISGCALALTLLASPAFGQAGPGASQPSQQTGVSSAEQQKQQASATAAQPSAQQPLNVALQPGQTLQITIQQGAGGAQPGSAINEAAGAQPQSAEVGKITLQGTVRDAAQKAEIEEHLIMVPGVTVDNQLRVAGPIVPDDSNQMPPSPPMESEDSAQPEQPPQ